MSSALKKTKIKGVYQKELRNKDIAFVIRYKSDGKVKDETLGRKSEGFDIKKAHEILEKRQSGFHHQESTNEYSNKSLYFLFSKYFENLSELTENEKHLDKQSKEHKTLENIKREFSIYKNNFENWSLITRNIRLLKDSDFEELKTELKKSYSNKSIYNAFALVNSVFKYYKIDKKVINKRPTPTIRESYLTKEELQLFLEKIKEFSYKYYLLCACMIVTGARPGSVLQLQVKDVNFKENIIKLYDFKRKMYYNSLLPVSLKNELEEFIKASKKFVFENENGEHYKELPKKINNLLKELFGAGIVPYTFRHSFATNLLKDGASLYSVSKALNHSSIKTTEQFYAKYSVDFLEQQLNFFSDLLLRKQQHQQS